jgi:hypothetical protein
LRTAAPFLLLLAGCRLGMAEPHWTDQLDPGGVCRQVNLLDGLDETDTAELHALFACLNRTGNLEPLAGMDAAMEAHSRTDEPIGLTVIKLSNRLPASGFDVFGLAGKALQALQGRGDEAELILRMTVEAMYGRSYTTVAESVTLNSPEELDRGLIRPALPLVSALAQTMLDDGDDIPDLMVSMLESDRVDAATCTLAALLDADDPELAAVADHLLVAIGASIEAATQTDNDLWPEASGNSIRDLGAAVLSPAGPSGQDAVEALTPDLLVLLGDIEFRDRIAVGLSLAEARDQLDHLPTQLAHLMSVDVDGYPLVAGRDSALHAGIRMLHSGNTTVVCTFLGFDVSLFNLSETVIELLAEEGMDDITSLVDFLGSVLDLPLTELLLDQIASRGYCPPIDEQFLEDIKVLERFHDDEVQALLPMVQEFLNAVHPSRGTSRVPELLSILSIVYQRDLVPPLEEAVRDQASTQLAADAMTLLPHILNPETLVVDACPDGSEPLDFDTLWAIGSDALQVGQNGQTALQTMNPLLRVILEHPATWQTLDQAAALAQDTGAEIQHLPALTIAGLEAVEDTDEARSMLVTLLDDEQLRDPVLALAESQTLMDAVGSAGGEEEGPLPFAARLITSEAVTVMLQTVNMVLDSLGGSDQSASD